jgi:hypothetical protein
MVASARSLDTQVRLLEPAIPYLVPDPPPVENGAAQLLHGLDPAIARQISSGTELMRSLNRRAREEVLPTSIEALDTLLGGGIARGKMIEVAGRGARFSMLTAMLAAATSIGEAAALIDLGNAFDPQIGEAAGIDLRRMLWIRPKTLKQAVTAAEMITSTGFQLVILDAGLPRLKGRVPDAAWVRLARSAESRGTALVISSPFPLTGTTSEAMLRASASHAKWRAGLLTGVETKVMLEKHRRKRPGESASLMLRAPEAIV